MEAPKEREERQRALSVNAVDAASAAARRELGLEDKGSEVRGDSYRSISLVAGLAEVKLRSGLALHVERSVHRNEK